jgi:putative tricarboxylic transport membrane protein
MRHGLITTAITAVSVISLAACGSGNGESGAGTTKAGGAKTPSRTEVVVHNAVGGGSDVFARQLIKIMKQEGNINKLWPVRNIPAGDGMGAMSFLKEKKGDNGLIATMTPTWLVTPMTVKGANVRVADLTAIAGVASEPQLVAVKKGSPYKSMTDFINAAKAKPGTLVQTGGSTTATDSLTGLALQKSSGAKWKFLSFEDTGSRITAVLRGDADIVMGSAGDFGEQVKAGKMDVITVLGPEKLSAFPQAPTATEQGIELDSLPLQFRGMVGAPGMSADAIAYYEGAVKKTLETGAWKQYAESEGLVTDFRDHTAYKTYLEQRTQVLGGLLEGLGLRKDQ